MQSQASTPDEYFATLPEDRKEAMMQLRKVIQTVRLEGFRKTIYYGIPAYDGDKYDLSDRT